VVGGPFREPPTVMQPTVSIAHQVLRSNHPMFDRELPPRHHPGSSASRESKAALTLRRKGVEPGADFCHLGKRSTSACIGVSPRYAIALESAMQRSRMLLVNMNERH